MNWLIYLFSSGVVFFLGVGLVIAALVIFVRGQRRWQKSAASLLTVIGLLLITASATPFPYWLYTMAGVVTVVWLIAERHASGWLGERRNLWRWMVVVVWGIGVGMEMPYLRSPRLGLSAGQTLYVVGDSVTAGIGGEATTWPRLIAANAPGIEVVDLSRMGATTASGLQQAESLPDKGGLVILEIGGNDLLGTTSAARFERDLEKLLERVVIPGRALLMFELPLPPLYNEFGRAQRRMAAKYGVQLIPKRLFASVLTGEGATLDAIHLDRAGHERMAEVVWSVIELQGE